MRAWMIAAAAVAASLSFGACQRSGGPATQQDYNTKNSNFPIGEAQSLHPGGPGDLHGTQPPPATGGSGQRPMPRQNPQPQQPGSNGADLPAPGHVAGPGLRPAPRTNPGQPNTRP